MKLQGSFPTGAMLQFWVTVVVVLLTTTCVSTQFRSTHDPSKPYICEWNDKAPSLVKNIHSEVKPYLYYLNETDDVDNVEEKCCGIYGCFSRKSNIISKECDGITLLPFCQNELQVKFYLWTKHSFQHDVIDVEDDVTLKNSKMVANSNVVIYINGYLGTGDMAHVKVMKNDMLKKNPELMFISVDWRNGSRASYMRAFSNAQMVAAVTSRLILKLMEMYSISPQDLHIIGVNIGAHAAGAVGKRIKGIGRITGLDPAGLQNLVCPAILRISMTDATFVDIIHTDRRKFGSPEPRGHLDIFINGAFKQPACDCPGCDHSIVIDYFIKTIQSELPYLAYQCDGFDSFMKGKCHGGCGAIEKPQCAHMGYRANEWQKYSRRSSTIMYMLMGEETSNYHLYHYHVEIGCRKNGTELWKYGRNKDILKIKLIGEDRKETDFEEIYTDSITYTADTVITSIITSIHRIQKIKSVVLKWIPKSPNAPIVCDNRNISLSPDDNDCLVGPNQDCKCNECIYKLSYIKVLSLEDEQGISFHGIEHDLPPNTEVKIGCQ